MLEDVAEPDGSAFFGVRNEDLPYNSERKSSRFSGPPPSLKEQGAMLLSALTGVINTDRKRTVAYLKNAKRGNSYAESAANVDRLPEYQATKRDLAYTAKRLANMTAGDGQPLPETNFYEKRGLRRASQGPTDRSPRPRVGSLVHIPRRMSALQAAQLSDRRRSSFEGSTYRSPRLLRSPRRGPGKDEACDTSDIPINTLFVESDDELMIETISSLDLERQRMEDPMKRNKMALDDYMGKLKDTTNRIGLRARMLHELTTEDLESSYSTLPPPPKARKVSSPGPGLVLEFEEEEKPTASLHVKQARRLAGSMNVHQQTNGLRDIHSWLQHLGSLAQEDDFVDAGGPRFKQKDGEKEEADGPSDWRLPSSPAMALQLAQEDLRNRLGSLYAERQQQDVLNRQAEMMAATALATKDGEAEEARLREFLRRMHMLEDEYHILGGKITENLSEAEKLDKRHHRLRKDVKESEQHGVNVKSSERRASMGDEEVHTEAKKKVGRKKTSKVEDAGLDEPVSVPQESKRKSHRRASQDENADGAAAAAASTEATLSTPIVIATAATPTTETVVAPAARGSLVKATPVPDTVTKEDEYAASSGIEYDGKPERSLSESVSKLLEDSNDEHDQESSDDDGPDFSDIEVRRKKSRKKTRVQEESGVQSGEDKDKDEETRKKRSSKRRAEGETRGGTTIDYENVSSLYEGQSSQDVKVKYIREDKRRSGTSQRSALDWKILLESGQCKHRSCQTDPSITERQKKTSASQDGQRRSSDATAQMDAKELRREVVRLKQRLRFWRARNWAEQHKTQHVSAPSTTGPQYMIDEAPGMRRSSSESADSRLTDTMTPYELGGLQGSFSVKGRDSIPSSKSPLPDQETIIHEENLKQGDLLPERTPSFVVFGRSPNQSPRDSRVGSLVPVARDSRAGSLTRSRTNSKGSVSIRRDSPAGAEALRLQTSPAALAERRTSK